MNFFKSYLEQLSSHNGGNTLDTIWCTLRYGASPNNYREFNFKELNSKQRDTYVTNTLSRKLIRKYNNPDYIDLFEDKSKLVEVFKDFYGR